MNHYAHPITKKKKNYTTIFTRTRRDHRDRWYFAFKSKIAFARYAIRRDILIIPCSEVKNSSGVNSFILNEFGVRIARAFIALINYFRLAYLRPSPRVVLINESSTHRGFEVRSRIYLRFAFRLDIASPVLVVLSFRRSFLVSFVSKRRHRPDRVSCLMEPFPGKISGRREAKRRWRRRQGGKCHIVGRTVAALSFEKRYISNRKATLFIQVWWNEVETC